MPQLKGKNNPGYKHGFAARGHRPTIYYKWQRMLARCYHPSQKDYAKYGAKGITVCDRWRFGEGGISGFICWFTDMGPPFIGATIDRYPNGKGNYEPGNCRWATITEQANNRKNNRHITARGQTLTIAQWSRVVGISRQALRYRVEQGADPEEILFRSPEAGGKLKTSTVAKATTQQGVTQHDSSTEL